jgi:hypothetical protein
MIAKDEEALICDLAETYHVLDYKALPVKLVAILANGLGNKSRIKKKLANIKVSIEEMMMASIADNLSIIQKSLSGHKEKLFLFTEYFGESLPENQKGFNSVQEFEETRKKLMKGVVR